MILALDNIIAIEYNRYMTFIKGHTPWNKGKRIGSKSGRWNPDRNSYFVLHTWVVDILGKPNKCSHCGSFNAKRFDWANISGKYLKDPKDWIRLCRGCHLKMDYTDERKTKMQETRTKNYGIGWAKKMGKKGNDVRWAKYRASL